MLAIDCPTATVLIDVHDDLPTRAMFARIGDHAFVAQRNQVPALTGRHDGVHWLPLSLIGVHFLPDQPHDIKVGFVPKLDIDRHAMLSQVLGWFHTTEYTRPDTPWKMRQVYSSSRILFNENIDGEVNMWVFEALAAGVLLATDRIYNRLDVLLTERDHVVGYAAAESTVPPIERYVVDENAREGIDRAGQRTLRAWHGYYARPAFILEAAKVAAAARPASVRRGAAAVACRSHPDGSAQDR